MTLLAIKNGEIALETAARHQNKTLEELEQLLKAYIKSGRRSDYKNE